MRYPKKTEIGKSWLSTVNSQVDDKYKLINTVHIGHLIAITIVWLPNSTNPANEALTNDFLKPSYIIIKSGSSKESHYRKLTMEKGKNWAEALRAAEIRTWGEDPEGFLEHSCDLAPFLPSHSMRHLWILIINSLSPFETSFPLMSVAWNKHF